MEWGVLLPIRGSFCGLFLAEAPDAPPPFAATRSMTAMFFRFAIKALPGLFFGAFACFGRAFSPAAEVGFFMMFYLKSFFFSIELRRI